MPDRRRHRGPHPQDRVLFAAGQTDRLLAAVHDLSWLLTRGYRRTTALELVGNRHALTSRQRQAVRHSSCSDEARRRRRRRRRPLDDGALTGRSLLIDGFNVLITLEAALSGAVVLRGRDGAHRDLSSVHRSYRRVSETPGAIRAVGRVLDGAEAGDVRWVLDRPVSNSGRLRALLLAEAADAGWSWTVDLSPHPDAELVAFPGVVATSDGAVLDEARAWCDLVGAVFAHRNESPWLVDLSSA